MNDFKSPVKIGSGEHVMVCGITGCGKSVLAENFLAGESRVIKLDTKDETSERRRKGLPLWNGLKENTHYIVATSIEQFWEYVQNWNKIIYVPTVKEQDPEVYNQIFNYAYETTNWNIWIDELMQVCDSPSKYPEGVKTLYTRGRSKDVTMWSLTQRPTCIPSITFSNTTHFFVYNLPLPQDRRKMVEVTSEEKLMQQMPPYHFWYLRYGSNKRAARGTLKLD